MGGVLYIHPAVAMDDCYGWLLQCGCISVTRISYMPKYVWEGLRLYSPYSTTATLLPQLLSSEKHLARSQLRTAIPPYQTQCTFSHFTNPGPSACHCHWGRLVSRIHQYPHQPTYAYVLTCLPAYLLLPALSDLPSPPGSVKSHQPW